MDVRKYSELVLEKEFSDEVSKEAYLKACAWLAKNIWGKPDYAKYITIQIKKKEKDKKEKTTTFIVSIYVTIDERESKLEYCKKCTQIYSIFFCVDKPKCEECKMNAYRKQLYSMVKNLKEYFEGEFKC